MFIGPWDQGGPWNPTGIGGVHRFLNRVWTLAIEPHGSSPATPRADALPAGQDVAAADASDPDGGASDAARVSEEHEDFRFNTMVAHLMELANLLMRYRGSEAAARPGLSDEATRLLLLMLAPAAPHITEELWSRRLAAEGREWTSIHSERWPEYDEGIVAAAEREVPVQVNGKLRDKVVVPTGISEIELNQVVLARDRIRGAAGRA